MSESIGMMAGSYFVSRGDLLKWINDVTGLGLSKIEQTANGVAVCHVFDALFPGNLRMEKVKFDARRDYEYMENYKVLQGGFNRIGITKHIPVDKLIPGKYQDNLEFMQWVKGYFDQHASENAKSYDAEAVRSSHGHTVRGVNRRPMRTNNSASRSSRAMASVRTASNSARSTTTSRARATKTAASTRAAAPPARAKHVPPVRQKAEPEVETVSKAEADALREEIAQLDRLLQEGDSERQFYFEKLQDIEGILEDLDTHYKDAVLDDLLVEVVKCIKQVLYSGDEQNNETEQVAERDDQEKPAAEVTDAQISN